ncbi:MAG: hypothetical protein AAFZ87_04915 [Planctomycetota bacterium]
MAGRPRKRRIDFELPLGADRSSCRFCGAPIAWIQTGEHPDGRPKRMPLDLGTVVNDLAGIPRAESHFAHCPSADRARASARGRARRT